MKFSYRELQRCAEREVILRRNVYAKRGMTPERAREVEMMVAIAELLKEFADEEPDPERRQLFEG